MSFEEQVEEIKLVFGFNEIKVFAEGGCRFLYLPSFFKDSDGGKFDCLFACDNHLGYPNRLWFPKVIATKEARNWNGQNVHINEKSWFAFSMKGKGQTLLEILMSHLMGAK